MRASKLGHALDPRPRRVRACMGGLLAGLLLGGCGGPGTSEESQAMRVDPAEFFPLVEGAVWTYQLSGLAPLPIEVVVRARGLRSVPGLESELFIIDESTDASVGFAAVAPVGYLEIGDYLGRYLGLDYDGDRLRLLGGEDPARFLPLLQVPSAESGGEHRWEERSRIFELPEADGAEQRWSYRAARISSLRVPAGEFQDVLRVESEFFDDPASAEASLRFEDFYAPHVGLICSRTLDLRADGRVSVEQLLLRYSFPEVADQGPGTATTP